jgi:hypothetical protein
MDEKLAIVKTIINVINGKEDICELLNKYNFQENKSSVSIIISSELKDDQRILNTFTPKALIYENTDYGVNILHDENKNFVEITFLTNENNINIIDEICNYYKLKIKIVSIWKGIKNYYLEPLETSELRDILVSIDNNSEKNIQIKFSQNKNIQNFRNIKFIDILRSNGIDNTFQYLKTEGIGKIFFVLKLFFILLLNLFYLKIIKIMNIFVKIETKSMIKRNKVKKNRNLA